MTESTKTKGNILLVDDLPENLQLLSNLLITLDYTVRKATSGKMALKTIKIKQPDLIFLDIAMPDLDGYQVCTEIKKDENLRDIPIIFMSALNDTFDKVKAFQCGGVDYITKPFQIEEVVARLETHLTIQKQQRILQAEIAKRKQIELDLKEANYQLNLQVNLDGLTQIANRRRFDYYLLREWQRHLRENHPLALILIDIDFFKFYNDYYGHQRGDDCLIQVAQTISHIPKRPTDLVARYGGEEFAVILPNTNSQGALSVAEEIKEVISLLKIPHLRSQVSQYVSLSLGVANIIPDHDLKLEDLINQADQALYQAKNLGRNQVFLGQKN